jgi:hypothetical protein
MRKLATLVVVSVLGLTAPRLLGTQKIALRVSPVVAMAPALVSARVTIEPNDDNRLLSLEIDSPNYRRASEMSLDGRNAPKTNVFDFKGLPSGLYEVRAVLSGPSGTIANTMQLVKVEPAAGYSH